MSWERLCAVVGPCAAGVIRSHYGGSRLYVPGRVAADHPLARLVGLDGARRMAEALGGCFVWIPMERRPNPRHEEIRTLRAEGKAVRTIARTVGLSDRQVQRILAIDDGPARMESAP